MNENLTQFIKVLLMKLSDMLDSSNFVRLFHHQSFVLYATSVIYYAHVLCNMDCHTKSGLPLFSSTRSKYIEIFEPLDNNIIISILLKILDPPGTKISELFGPP